MENLFKDTAYLAYVKSFLTPHRLQRFQEVLKNRTYHFTVAVEDVYQLHNTSAVMRSCEVFGIQDLHVIEQKFGKEIDKEIAMGAEKWVDIHRYKNAHECIATLKAKGYKIVGTTPHKPDCTLEKFDIQQKSALFFGTEKTGLSEDILTACDDFIFIPMVGFTESLNISVSAAIILQRITEKLRMSNIPWQLSDAELLAKTIDWCQKSIKNIDGITQVYLEKNKKAN